MARGNSKGSSRQERNGGDGFWDRPVLINLLADVLLLAGGALLAWAGVMALQRLPVFPLRQLVVATPLDQVSRAQIEYTARGALSGNFFTVNLETVQAAFERMPWVRSASVRRLWPDGIELNLEEHRAAARWTPQDGEPRLVSMRGEVFMATTRDALPVFTGPEGSATRVLARYEEFRDSLGGIGRKPVAVHLSAREAWQIKLDDGVLLELGRDQARHPLTERLNRFTSHYAAVSGTARSRLQTIGAVDMRYPNGFALRGGAAPHPSGKGLPPPPFPRPGAGVTSHLPRMAGGEGGVSRSTASRRLSRLAVQSQPWADGRGCPPLAMPCGRLEAA
jgi:cell division protein FtsQ